MEELCVHQLSKPTRDYGKVFPCLNYFLVLSVIADQLHAHSADNTAEFTVRHILKLRVKNLLFFVCCRKMVFTLVVVAGISWGSKNYLGPSSTVFFRWEGGRNRLSAEEMRLSGFFGIDFNTRRNGRRYMKQIVVWIVSFRRWYIKFSVGSRLW